MLMYTPDLRGGRRRGPPRDRAGVCSSLVSERAWCWYYNSTGYKCAKRGLEHQPVEAPSPEEGALTELGRESGEWATAGPPRAGANGARMLIAHAQHLIAYTGPGASPSQHALSGMDCRRHLKLARPTAADCARPRRLRGPAAATHGHTCPTASLVSASPGARSHVKAAPHPPPFKSALPERKPPCLGDVWGAPRRTL